MTLLDAGLERQQAPFDGLRRERVLEFNVEREDDLSWRKVTVKSY